MQKKQIVLAIASALASFGDAFAGQGLVPVVIGNSIVSVDIDAVDKNDANAKKIIVTGEDGVQYKVVALEIGDTTVVIHRLGSEEQRYAMKTQAFKGMVLGLAELLTKQPAGEQTTAVGPRKPHLVVDLNSRLKKAA